MARAHDTHAHDGFAPGWTRTQEGDRQWPEDATIDAAADADAAAPFEPGPARPPLPPGTHGPDTRTGAASGDLRLPPELAALRGLLPDATLAAALARARHLGVGGDEVLIAAGLIDPDAASAALADHLGLPRATLPRRLPLDADGVRGALRTGMLAQADPARGAVFTLCPRGHGARRLARAMAQDPGLAGRTSILAPERLRAHLARYAGPALTRQAAFDLRRRMPEFSAALLSPVRILAGPLLLAAALLATGFLATPQTTFLIVQGMLSVMFLGAIALRLAACFITPEPDSPCRLGDHHLPIYTVMVPLYREAAVLPRLLAALTALDYPPEKLDIKLVVEEDDRQTREALRRLALPARFEIIPVPAIGPRTKPKALNAALPFARGQFLVVYDAEDIPEPGQLRAALAAFQKGGPRLACVQARLAIDNGGDSWISRQFALEYAVQFDVVLPAVATFGLPMPLGGTSNHFRRSVLEGVGAWDPYNVTEDADLGLRLARKGWRTEVIASTTHEEAPVHLRPWLRQRTRWMKGWAQTLLVHGRDPRRLVRELGAGQAVGATLLVAFPFVAALLHPLCVAVLCWDMARGALGASVSDLAELLISSLSYTNLAFGYGGAAVLALCGARRRGLLSSAFVLPTLTLYWLLLSLATLLAMVELIRAPHRWNKTEHGVAARTRARSAPASAGGHRVREDAAGRPPPRPATA
ncbi:glycosyltransferase [Roseixanthobacter pseudopolyaromaticivorans]|uniref:glycosyltransferase n=1 Tax=Xanthobacteraceae TaxID=335928 RepID=UPI003729F2EA